MSKIEAKFHTFWPYKIRGGVGKIAEPKEPLDLQVRLSFEFYGRPRGLED